jgi:hypothetical protein
MPASNYTLECDLSNFTINLPVCIVTGLLLQYFVTEVYNFMMFKAIYGRYICHNVDTSRVMYLNGVVTARNDYNENCPDLNKKCSCM